MNPFITVLYIDDEPINLMLFTMNFRKTFNVITAQSGEEGLRKLHSTPDVRVVISDMKMPGMNGIQFINLARADFPQILYYILTGYDITREIAEAINNKVISRCFRKPIDLKEIKISIEDSLKI